MTQTTNGDAQHLHRPRILCLHGGGVNAAIFEAQCRAVTAQLRAAFRLVFVEGPFLSAPHPSVVAVYGDHGPFRRWLRWLPEHPDTDAASAAAEIWGSCRRAMDDDPGDGEWVGILGFSQGAKIAASVLWTQQQQRQAAGVEAETDFKFGVLMAGRGPFVALDTGLEAPRHVVDAAQLSSAFDDWPKTSAGPHALDIPTLHVHGTRDPGLELHRILRDKFCRPGTTRCIEWDGGHRIPIKPHDVDALVRGILDLAQDAGV